MAPNRTTSMDLPPVLAQLLGPMTSPVTQSPTMQMPPMQQAFNPAASGMSAGMTRDNAMMPSYAMGGMVDEGGMSSGMMQQQQPVQTFVPNYAVGGMVGAGGMPEGGLGAPGMPQGGMPQMVGAGGGAVGLQEGGTQQRMTLQQADMQINDFIRNRPQEVAQIQAVVQAGLQAGEFTLDDFNMMEQMAITALQNPEMYPNIRQLAIQQGFAAEEDLSLEYDEGLIYVILVAARVAKMLGAPVGGAPAGGAPAGGAPVGGVPSFAMGGTPGDMTVRPGDMAFGGGKVEGPGTGTSDSVPIRVSTGEYVIPANVVRMKGKEFFDSMLEKYKDT
jgi:hypothetical protein